MSDHEHDHHGEPEQNEIGGPVTLAIFLFIIAIVVIALLGGGI